MKAFHGRYLILIFLLATAEQAAACITCNRQIQQAIFDSAFYPNLFTMLSPFMVLAIVVAVFSAMAAKQHSARMAASPGGVLPSKVPLTSAAVVTGIGLGGFADGIVFHQILQWHQMLSNKIPPDSFVAKSVNMFWDGIFHSFTLLVTLTGVLLLWKLLSRKNIQRSGNLLAGGLLLGWGAFNIIEGIADHHLLKLHNVKELSTNAEAWNYGFLAFSILLTGAGFALVKKTKHQNSYSGAGSNPI